MSRIFIVEDNKKIRDEIGKFLTQNGYQIDAADDFQRVKEEAVKGNYDLILLDINLPVYDGFFICREIRKESNVPIIVVTSRNTDIDELMAMNFGADDFITKPYNTQILLARIASILRRASGKSNAEKVSGGSFALNLGRSVIEFNGEEFELTKNEFKILNVFIQNKGKIVPRDELMENLWNSDVFVDDNTLTVNVNRLRRKLKDIGLAEEIQTKRGQGYILE